MRVLFFAQLKDATGCDSAELAVSQPLRSDQLWDALLEKFPALAAHRASVRLACNLQYAHPQLLFNPDDEVALIPPVSGG
jgi:molybdopterin converting factor subunit 1